MALHELRLSICRKLGYSDSPAPEITNRLNTYINEAHRRLLGMPGMDYLRQARYTLNTVASTPEYSLPTAVSRILSIRDTTNDVVLRGEPWGWYTANTADPTVNSGSPEVWCPRGEVPYIIKPDDSDTSYIASSSASDTQTCFIEGYNDNGVKYSGSFTLTGTTPVATGFRLDQMTKFYLSSKAVGNVSYYEGTTADTVATILPGNSYARHLRIAIWPTPAATYALTIDYLHAVDDMSEWGDEPLVPPDFHWVIEAGARMLEYERLDDRRYAAAKADHDRGVRDLKWFCSQQADGRPMMGGVAINGSRLGPWYPRGT